MSITFSDRPIRLTLSTPKLGDAWQALLLYQVILVRWFSINFCMFHLLTKLWTLCKVVLSYIVCLYNFSVNPFMSCFLVYGDKCKFVQFCWKIHSQLPPKLGEQSKWKGLCKLNVCGKVHIKLVNWHRLYFFKEKLLKIQFWKIITSRALMTDIL
jgi:hypothetical protein